MGDKTRFALLFRQPPSPSPGAEDGTDLSHGEMWRGNPNVAFWEKTLHYHSVFFDKFMELTYSNSMPPQTIYHRMKALNARMAANYQRGIGPTGVVLLLTTTGRKSGLPRTTPLQFEEVDGKYYIASARGQEADWFKNLLANPQVRVQVGKKEFAASAEPVTDPRRIADFLELRLRRHPRMVRLIMHLADGLPLRFTRAHLEALANGKALVILTPTPD